ncbi:putative quinol monooxygenase [Pontibacter roseus]|uniref:putative quinol monooxygenase n=1 Tax=Pontibacter roseus TaxID=336989 RepID=UPI0003A1A3C5|nr:putative quinol monooxygenase [Pontibacter roseus]
MTQYGLHGRLNATPGNGENLAHILLQAAELVRTAQGCRLYLVSRDNSTPDAVWVTEVWDSQEDHDNSLLVPGVRELIGEAMPLLAGKPEKGQVLEVLGGVGLK